MPGQAASFGAERHKIHTLRALDLGPSEQDGAYDACFANVVRGAPAGRVSARVQASEDGRRDAWQAAGEPKDCSCNR